MTHDDLIARLDNRWLDASRSAFDCATCGLAANDLAEAAARIRELEAELAREKTAVYDMVEACKRAEAESHYRGCLVRDLLPYQERAVIAEAERDALRADAERYRWLRDEAHEHFVVLLSKTRAHEWDANVDTRQS